MLSRMSRLPLVAGAGTSFLFAIFPAFAQSTIASGPAPQAGSDVLPDLVITATRSPLAVQRAGSAITVISAEEIAAYGSRSIADVLKIVPGLDITESGGAGTLSNASLRGSKPDQTLVLLDGIRIGDPSSIGGEFDFGTFSATDIERIEVLRGPQSALYGSDAMGGVINIITRKGNRVPRASASVEAGSYGTLSTRGAISGSTDRATYAFSFNALHSDGFSRYGARIPRITSGLTAPLERDSTDKFGVRGSIGYKLSDQVDIEAGLAHHWLSLQLDNPGAFDVTQRDNRFDIGTHTCHGRPCPRQSARVRWASDQQPHAVRHKNGPLQPYSGGMLRSRDVRLAGLQPLLFPARGSARNIRADVKTGRMGTFTFGLRTERETADTAEQWLGAFATSKMQLIDKSQDHKLGLRSPAIAPDGPLGRFGRRPHRCCAWRGYVRNMARDDGL